MDPRVRSTYAIIHRCGSLYASGVELEAERREPSGDGRFATTKLQKDCPDPG